MLGASAQGLLVLRIKFHDVNNLKAWTLVGNEKTIAPRLFLLLVTHLEGCKVAKVQALSPIGLAKLTKQDAPRACVYITMGGVEAVEKAAAREGFRGLTCAFLEKAMTHFKLRFAPSARPTRERDMVSALVRACWPEVTEAELAASLKARGQTHTLDDANAVLLDPEEIDALDIGLDADDLKVVKDQAKKVKVARDNKKGKAGGGECTHSYGGADRGARGDRCRRRGPEGLGLAAFPASRRGHKPCNCEDLSSRTTRLHDK